MARPAPHLGRIAISLLIVGAVAGFGAETLIFEDGFETGDISRWRAPPPPPTPTPTPIPTPVPTPTVRLSDAAITVAEGGGDVTLLVELIDGGADDVRVDWVGRSARISVSPSPKRQSATVNS